jgi:hypothetical protein
MTTSLHTGTKKRKISTSPSRKKARTGAGAPEIVTPPTPTGPAAEDERDLLAEFLRDIGAEDLLPPPEPLVGTPPVATTPPPAVAGPRPANPFAGTAKKLRGNFGTGYHDVAHFQPTRNKSYHGVWEGTRNAVKAWVRLAVSSIREDDRFIVASKPGKDGGYTYLISMDGTTVGYLSGSSVPAGQKPPAQHIEVYLDKKGNTVSAFPSSPDRF